MLTRKELEHAIEQYEQAPSSLKQCERLAWFYIVMDHMFPEEKEERMVSYSYDQPEDVVMTNGGSEFLDMINGKDSLQMWELMDDLMGTIKVLNPRLYASVIRKINGG